MTLAGHNYNTTADHPMMYKKPTNSSEQSRHWVPVSPCTMINS
jgi:hypothetical protein